MSGLQAAEKWTLVSSEPESWEGDYLIVYEDKAFNGSLTKLDAVNDYTTVTVSGNEITTDVCDFYFTIEQIDGGYSIKSASGYYIYQTSDKNGLQSSTSTTGSNAITFKSSDDIEIVSEGAHLRFNATSNQMRFRYYRSSTYTDQKPIQLYKKQTEVNKCAAPEFSLAEGTYNETQTLTITSSEGSTIVYTINDEMQTAPSPAEIELPVDGVAVTYTIEAYATMEGAEDSEVVTKTYTIDPNAVVEQTESIVIAEVADEMGWMNGAKYEWFQKGGFRLDATGVDGNGNESGKYYDNDDTWRFYGDGTLTVTASASVEIIKIEFTTGDWQFGECSTGVMSDGNKVWTSDVEKTATVSFTFTKASRIKSMNITYRSIPAGVEGVETADAAIRANADGVVVVAADAVAEVYNAAGQLVATAAVDGESVIAVPAGFYVVRVGNTIAKVVVR